MIAGLAGSLLAGGGLLVLVYSLLADGDQPIDPVAATPAVAPTAPLQPSTDPAGPAQPDVTTAPPLLTYDYTGRYVFPIAADPRAFSWTQKHWDGINAADIEVRAGVSRAEFDRLTSSQLVAITDGIAHIYSGAIGGQGYMLQGDDGVDYYYAHLSQQWVPDGTRVRAGQVLGVIGSTGGTAQFIEPHLHLAIGPRDSLWTSPPSINTAGWLQERFGLSWREVTAAAVQPDQPEGWPVPYAGIQIVTTYEQAAQTLPQPAIELGFAEPPDVLLEVYGPLHGEVNVIRWTPMYGTRIQITNEPSLMTVVISGVDEWLVEDGDVVSAGQVIARWNPAHRPKLHYMIYRNSVIIDPTPSLGSLPS